MTRLLARSSLGLIILVLAALPFALNGTGSEVARATHDGNIHQVSIDVGPPGVNQGVTVNGLPAVVDRDGDGIADAEGFPTPGFGDPGICGNGVDDDLADTDSDTIPDTADGSIDDGCQVDLSALETCVEIIDDGVLNADEDTQVTGQDRASIDITLGDQPGPGVDPDGGGVPSTRQMSAWQYTLQWDVDVLDVDVQSANFLILADGGGQPFTLVVPSFPVTASPFVQAVNDAGPKESGAGVLARVSIEGNLAGLATLSFNAGGTLVQDAVNVGIGINTLNTALVAVSKDNDASGTIGDIPGESFGCPEPADVELVDVTTTAPAGATAGTAFNVAVDANVRNNGPADPVSGNVAITLNMPADCNAAGGNTRNQNGINLPATVLVPITTETFSVTCTASSFHDFNATATISSPGAIGDNPNNNGPTTSVNSTTAVTSTADPGVGTVSVTGPASPVAGVPFNVDVGVTLTNGGPDPATVDVTITLTPPAGCSTSSTNPQTVTGVAIPLSGANAAATFSVTCSPSGSYIFDASAALVLPGLHFTDTNLQNNTGAGQGTVNVADAADLKVTSVAVTVPANTSVGAAFDVTADVIVHNNGPSSPVNADVTNTLVLPPDCTTDTATPNPSLDSGVALAVSVATTLPHTWTVTCTQPSNHDFTVNSGIALAAGQPNVLDPNTANDTGTGAGTSATATSADLKVASVSLTTPASANLNTAFNVSVDATLHNNGPFGPVNSNATTELTVPSGCTATPAGAQTAANISLPVSTATALPKQTFSVTCTTSGSHAFSAKVTVAMSMVHVSDPTAGNATATSATQSVSILAAGQLPPTGGSRSAPSSGLTLLLLLPLGAVIAGAGLLTLRRNRRGMRF